MDSKADVLASQNSFLYLGCKLFVLGLSIRSYTAIPLGKVESSINARWANSTSSTRVLVALRVLLLSISTNLYKATRIPNSQQYTATDKESLNYRSKLNPGYYFDNKYLKILPAPSNSTTDKAIVHYIDYDSYPISNKDLEITPGNYNITTNT